jgi:hypothetical protein
VSSNNSGIIAKIENFQNKIIELRNNNGLSTRSGDNMEVDDFLWNMEALLNFKYGEPNKPFGSIVEKNDIVEIPLNSNGKLNTSDLVKAVESFRLTVGMQWASVNLESKHVITIDLSLVENSNQNLASTAKVRIGIGIGGGPAPINNGPFNEGDSYFYGFHFSTCSQTVQGKDAADRLNDAINLRFPTYAKYSGFFVSLVSEFTVADVHLLKTDDKRNNDRDSKFFLLDPRVPGFTDEKKCINGSDMNFYYNNLNLFLRQEKVRFGNLDFACINFRGDAHAHIDEITQEQQSHLSHQGTYYFGEFALADCQRVCNPEEGIGAACFYTPCGY